MPNFCVCLSSRLVQSPVTIENFSCPSVFLLFLMRDTGLKENFVVQHSLSSKEGRYLFVHTAVNYQRAPTQSVCETDCIVML